MRPVSLQRARELRLYKRLRVKFLDGHPWCEFPGGCNRPTAVVHHRRGRDGARLNDVSWWAASCIEHNDYAETHTGEALAMGWLVRINSKPADE
jgi:hypothetical protein